MKQFCMLLLLLFCNSAVFAQSKKVESLKEWLKTSSGKIESQKFSKQAIKTKEEAKIIANIIYSQKAEIIRDQFAKDWDNKKFVFGDYTMLFDYKIFGEEPKEGRSLYISMHGGGNTTAEVNDKQWQNQINLYTPKEGIYLAPRASVNDWDMWFQPHVDIMFANIIKSAVAIKNVNPNRVYIMGYSAGGDGVYRLATRMADKWAAAAMMAGHPGNVSPLNLRNIGFSLWMGENDTAYNRNNEAVNFGERLDSLKREDPMAYWHDIKIVHGKGHWMERVDSAAVPWMAKFSRNSYPKKINWIQDDVIRDNFYWLFISKREALPGSKVIIECENNTIEIFENDYSILEIGLNDSLINFDKPVEIKYKGKRIFKGQLYRTIGKIFNSIDKTGDPSSVYSATLTVVDNKEVLGDQIIKSVFY